MDEANRTCYLMGTVIKLWVQHPHAEQLLSAAEQKLIDYEKRFSANDQQSQLMRISTFAGQRPVKVDYDLFELIDLGKQNSQAPGSFLNIAIGPLIHSWQIGFSDAKEPTPAEVQAALKLINTDHIVLNRTDQTVFLTEPGMSLDLGSLAKGYFADQIIADFKMKGALAGMIDLGGNILTFGDAPEHADHQWRIGIQNPFQPRGNYVLSLKIQNLSIVTSGIYERQNTFHGKTFHHIFDQRTGYPVATDVVSLSVISEKSVDGEIWTTRLFGQSPQQMIISLKQPGIIGGVVITKQGDLLYSGALKSLIERR
ncbi:FAD:protein FMN transferase [Paucilactobacillus vaccinostercus]|nr:FAD:protein FMN transferase [Paucilactobacillus vaccinostercus]